LEFVQQVSAEEKKSYAMVVGLFGKEAPQAVAAFKSACAGKLDVPCPTDVDTTEELTERGKQSKKAALKACLGSASEPLSYSYSQVWSIQRGKRIGAGAVQGKFALRKAPVTPLSESVVLTHDAAGLLSVRRGGGTFDFFLSTAATPEDDEEYAVIGRVLDGIESLAGLDALPVVKAAEYGGVVNVADTSQSREKACAYDSPQPFCAQLKPLRKVTLLRTAVL
jgi:cyclophilin family peptidyl-prolyl cis-trans isomerase